MSVATDRPPKPGEIVSVRSRRYLVEAVDPAPRPEDQTLVRLSFLEDDAEGEELEVLWQKEVDALLVSEADWSRLARGHFDLPRHSQQGTDGSSIRMPIRFSKGVRLAAIEAPAISSIRRACPTASSSACCRTC